MASRFRYFFTLTAGRTGTAWLAHFLGANLGIAAVHELLGIDDFGVEMPDIKTMRSFNERGNDAHVRAFWAGKLGRIAARQRYVETNHTLAKCGLIENLANSQLAQDSVVIVLRRDRIGQCASYLVRGDFLNVSVDWQWYLSPRYRNVMVAPGEFLKLGQIGAALWYCYEMEARQAYYLSQFGDRLNFVEARLEEITKPPGARALLGQLGIDADPVMPAQANANLRRAPEALTTKVTELVARIRFDPARVVAEYLASGRTL